MAFDKEVAKREAERKVSIDSLSLKCDACKSALSTFTLTVEGKKEGSFCSTCVGVRSNVAVEGLVKAAEMAWLEKNEPETAKALKKAAAADLKRATDLRNELDIAEGKVTPPAPPTPPTPPSA